MSNVHEFTFNAATDYQIERINEFEDRGYVFAMQQTERGYIVAVDIPVGYPYGKRSTFIEGPDLYVTLNRVLLFLS